MTKRQKYFCLRLMKKKQKKTHFHPKRYFEAMDYKSTGVYVIDLLAAGPRG